MKRSRFSTLALVGLSRESGGGPEFVQVSEGALYECA
jgi:hypothetical protein